MRIGSLFSGYGGLDLGVQSVLGGEVVWHVEIDKGPAAILAHHFPHVPNLGDVTKVDWATVPPIDVLTGGFPCQDVSHAGLRRGLAEGTRSGLWTVMAQAVDALRPSLVVIENVRGLLSATAHSDMEPCPWCVGDGDGQPALRALGAVLGDLAELGYDAKWASVRASDVGACHRRERVFVVGRPAPHSSGERYGGREDAGVVGRVGAEAAVGGRQASTAREVTSDRGHADAADADAPGPQGPGDSASGPQAGRRGQSVPGAVPTPADSERLGHGQARGTTEGEADEPSGADSGRSGVSGRVEWGVYEPAIRRWEQRIGRPAPSPTEPGSNSRPRLSPRFVEWMMGLPEGWVTDPGIRLARNAQLKALGNGVVPAQAAHALRLMLGEGR